MPRISNLSISRPRCPVISYVYVSALSLGQHIRAIKALVEAQVEVMRLEGEHCSEWPGGAGKAPIPPVHIVAVCDSRLNCLIGVTRYACLDVHPISPARRSATIVLCSISLRTFVIDQSEPASRIFR